MSATCAVLGSGWAWSRRRIALWSVLFSCLVVVSAGVPAARLLPGARSELRTAPVGLQAAASAAIGAGQSQFAVRDRGGTLAASGGGLSYEFGRAGPVVHASRGQVHLQFTGIGYGTLTRPATTVPHASQNLVSYQRSGVSEWYRSGPLGLEQGFTISRRPSAKAAGAWLTLAVSASGSLQPRKQGDEILFGNFLRYGGLSALDATGRSLPVKLGLRGRTLLLRVNDKEARYPLTIDPFVQQGTKLTPSGAVGLEQLGMSVALSTDGTTALVGGGRDNNDAGAVWVFTRSGSTWTQQGSKLTPTGEGGPGQFGTSVALSADGNTALIGADYDGNGYGAAWVFSRSGSTWTQQSSKLLPGPDAVVTGNGFSFGMSVALSADGNTALVSAPDDNNGAGAAWMYTRTGSTWTQVGPKLAADDETGAATLGWSIALSGDGNTALMGGPVDNAGRGAAWVFARSGST